MKISYRKAVLEDAVEQLHIQREAFWPLFVKYQDEDSPANMSLEEMKGKISNPYGSYYVIIVDGTITGGIYVYPCNASTEMMYLCSIYVLPSLQGNGVAQNAITFIESHYPETKRWVLEVPEKEEKNIHIYKKMGYQVTSKKEKINERLTIVTYAKEIYGN